MNNGLRQLPYKYAFCPFEKARDCVFKSPRDAIGRMAISTPIMVSIIVDKFIVVVRGTRSIPLAPRSWFTQNTFIKTPTIIISFRLFAFVMIIINSVLMFRWRITSNDTCQLIVVQFVVCIFYFIYRRSRTHTLTRIPPSPFVSCAARDRSTT